MDSKRKLNGGGAVNEELDDRATKRRRTLPEASGETAETTTQHGLNLVAQIKKLSDKSGRQIAEDFIDLVPKRDLPDYYEIIKMPVAISTIESQLKRHQFPNLTALENIFQRMVANAKIYNEDFSDIVQDANRILKAVTAFMKKENPAYKTPGYVPFPTPIPGETPAGQDSEGEDSDVDADGEIDEDVDSASTPVPNSKRRGRPPRTSNPPGQQAQVAKVAARAASGTPARSESQTTTGPLTGLSFQQAQDRILTEIMRFEETPGDESPVFEVFLNLPPRSLRDYYQVIPQPVSLKGIQKRVRGIHGRNDPTGVSDFKTWAQFEEEVSLVWKNALHYNEDGSEIWVLANDLKKFFEKLFNQVKNTVPEPSGPKLKIKMSAPAEPTPKITLRVGAKASPASDSPAPTTVANGITQAPQNAVGAPKPTLGGQPGSSNNLPPQNHVDRTRSMSGPIASPAPSATALVKSEDGTKPSPSLTGVAPTSGPVNSSGLDDSSVIHVNGNYNPMMPPGTTGVAGGFGASTVQPTSAYHQPAPNPSYNQGLRLPGKTAADAMISNLILSTHPGLNITRHFRLEIPAHPTKAQNYVTVSLEHTHYYLQIRPMLAAPLLERQHKLFVTVNGQRLHGMPSIPGQPVDQRTPLFEARLLPGKANTIEVELVAALPKGAPKPAHGPELELEKITVFAHLLKA